MRPRSFIDPAFTLGRLASGAAGGLAGGLAFGLLMMTPVILATGDIGSYGLLPLVQELLGTTSWVVIWTIHALMSIFVGMVYSLIVPTHSYRTSMLLGLAYGFVVWLVASQFTLRALTGAPLFVFDPGAAYSLIGHLIYGFILGLVYVGFHNLEVREALDAQDPRVREWGRREREA